MNPIASTSSLEFSRPVSNDSASFLSESPTTRREYLALQRERDPELRDEGLLALARRLENQGQETAAAALFQELSLGSGSTRARAFAASEALQGRGSWGPRTEILLRKFFAQAAEPTALFGMAVGSTVFRGVRLASLSAARAWGWAGTLARSSASLAGLAAEAPSFVLSSKLGATVLGRPQEWSAPALGREIGGAYLTLLGLRGAGALGQGALGSLTPALRSNPFLQSVFHQGGMLGGILLAHSLEVRAGLRPGGNFSDALFDGMATLLHFNLAGRLSRAVLGQGMATWERRLDSRIESLGQNFPNGPAKGGWIEAFQPSPLPIGASAGTLRPLARPAFEEPMMMSNNDGVGRGDRPSQSGTRPSFSAEPRSFPEADAILQGLDHPNSGLRAFLNTLPIPASAARANPDGSMRIVAANGSFVREFGLTEIEAAAQPLAELLRLGAAPVTPARLWTMLRGGAFKATTVDFQARSGSQKIWISGVVRRIYDQDFAFTFYQPIGERGFDRPAVHPEIKAFQNIDGMRRLSPDASGYLELRSVLELGLQLSNRESYLLQQLVGGDVRLRLIDAENWPLRDISFPLERVLSQWAKSLRIPPNRSIHIEQAARRGEDGSVLILSLGLNGFSPSEGIATVPSIPQDRPSNMGNAARRVATPPPRVAGLFQEVQKTLARIAPWPQNKDPKKPSDES